MSAQSSGTSKYSADLALAQELADAADVITTARYRALDLVITTKPDATPVTDADKAVESALRELITKVRPGDKIIGEEFGNDGSDAKASGRHWVIDPIDGTKNFMRAVPVWATLIALVENGEVVVGVISAPALNRRWYAAKGSGAYVHSLSSTESNSLRKISVSKVAQFSDASLSFSDLVGWGANRDNFIALMDQVWRTRGIGDFWSHMLVAEGAVDIAAEPSLALWDMAAIDIIVREAGGTFTDLSGTAGPHGKSAVSSNSLLHSAALKKITHG
jgi:histidinol-phosphatase